MGKRNLERFEQIRALASKTTSSDEIAEILNIPARDVRKYLTRYNLPRMRYGARRGEKNHQYQTGRRITLDGYALITPPEGHPTARQRSGRFAGYMSEHRYVMEQKIGRLLEKQEIIDHVDGLTLHNHPDNLRLFSDNTAHLQATITSSIPNWSVAGYQRMCSTYRQRVSLPRVDIHRQRKVAGAVRLRQILLLALQLGTDSPYLLGTTRWLEIAGIDLSQHSTIKPALDALCQQWEWPLLP